MKDIQVEKILKQVEESLAKQDPRKGLRLITNLRQELTQEQEWFLAKTYFWENICYKHLGNLKESQRVAEKGIKLFKKIGDFVEASKILRDLGLAYEYAQDYDKALKLLNESLGELKNNDVIDAVGITSSKIGQIYLKKGDFEKAFYYCDLGYRICKEGYNSFFLLTSILPLSLVFFKAREYERSLELLESAEDILKKVNKDNKFINERRKGEISLRKALNFAGLKEFEQSFSEFKKFSKYCLTTEPEERAVFTKSNELGELFIALIDSGYREKVRKFLKRNLNINIQKLSDEVQVSI